MKKENQIEKIRHSTAHIMAAAIFDLFPETKFGIGPVIENGFYYDIDLPQKLSLDDLSRIEKKMKELIKQNLKFKKEYISLNNALKLFRELKQDYKIDLLKDIKTKGTTNKNNKGKHDVSFDKSKISIYRTGKFIDLCRGPHVKTTKEINNNGFKLMTLAGAYWRGNENNPMLQRIYGAAFATKRELNEYLDRQKELGKRDHRKLGKDLDLFSMHDVSPGSVFWHPKGMIVVKELEKIWRKSHEELGYQEISTPIMVKTKLFEKSGHIENYKENMFFLKVDNEEYALKPMNCPESTYIYRSKIRSYKDLPLKLSEIGRLHRNELSGVISGLFRVRQITMDDAHIFCRQDQVQKEISGVLKLIKNFYKEFNFKLSFNFATRPKDKIGSNALWNKAEKDLETALKKNRLRFSVKKGDGAFYGPKIDVHLEDALGREWQMATIQLDYQLPERFNLEYTDEKGEKNRPIIIHRAVFGSFERFIGILIEHYAGALPFWLSPIQVKIVPIGLNHIKYARNIGKSISENGVRCEIADQNETVSKKIREAELQKIPYLLVVGDKEIKSQSVSVRKRGKGDIGIFKIDKFIANIVKEKK